MPESRRYNSEYYDAITTQTDDIEFYRQFVNQDSSVLELGCGTGRVSLALSGSAKKLVGVDISDEMLRRANAKNPNGAVQFVLADICSVQLQQKFGLIIAPFRVMQALETDEQVRGFLKVIRDHLHPEGVGILNVFRPFRPNELMASQWPCEHETPHGEVTLPDGDILRTSDTRRVIDVERQVLHPELIHRRYRDGKLIDEHVNPICMRYYYPDQFKQLIEDAGFRITRSWGGYRGEVYGEGPELVVAFGVGPAKRLGT